MGFSDELFETPPSQHLICAVCHDVFRDASMLRCGHTFCHNCIIKTLSRAAAGSCRCPICRVPTYGVKDISPNLITRQLISDLPMRCVQGEYRRQRCGWKGTVAQWTAHCAKDCPNQDLRCNLDGCTWRYCRRHRSQHLKAKHLHLYLSEQNEKYCKHEPQMIEVGGAKVKAVNGIFFLDGFNEKGTAVYKRQLLWNGVATTCVIAKYVSPSKKKSPEKRDSHDTFCHPYHENQISVADARKLPPEQSIMMGTGGEQPAKWFISLVPLGCRRGDVHDIDVYHADAVSGSKFPPSSGWHDIRDGREERAVRSLVVKPYGEEEEQEGDERDNDDQKANRQLSNDGVAQGNTSLEYSPARKRRRISASQVAAEATVCLDGSSDYESSLFSDSSSLGSSSEEYLSESDEETSPADSVREINTASGD